MDHGCRRFLSVVSALTLGTACSSGDWTQPAGEDASLDVASVTDSPAQVDRGPEPVIDVVTVGPMDVPAPPPSDAGSADVTMFPAFLHGDRTYDQERGYIGWDGRVEHVTIRHRDNTSLPPDEGGAACGGTCTEQVTRIYSGSRIFGRFRYVQTFSAQVASVSGAGTAVIEACGAVVGRVALQATSTTAGFTNHPQPAFMVPTAGECAWSVRAEGGNVDLRAVTVQLRGVVPPTVDLRVDGTDGPTTVNAPGTYVLSWTSANASGCTASESWTGPRDVTGSTRLRDVTPGAYTYRVTCLNGAGTATDSVTVTVNRPPG